MPTAVAQKAGKPVDCLHNPSAVRLPSMGSPIQQVLAQIIAYIWTVAQIPHSTALELKLPHCVHCFHCKARNHGVP